MELIDVWPLFGLRLVTPRLELRVVRDDDLPGLAAAAEAGIHESDRMPFARPWSEAPPEQFRPALAQFVWDTRTRFAVDDWTLLFAVRESGTPIGVQDMAATDFTDLRTVRSGSWLTKSRQGLGLGTEMRAAMLMLAFDHLGAEIAESGAVVWNEPSLGVSRRLGYRENGRNRFSPRPGDVSEEVRFRLTADEFRRPEWSLQVEGVDEARRALIRANPTAEVAPSQSQQEPG